MAEVQVWILTAVVGFFMSIFLMLFKNWMSDQKEQQRKVVDVINELRLTLVEQQSQMKTLFNNHINTRADIKELNRRIDKVERQQYQCGKCVGKT